jgi:hypothetical protein
MKASISLTELFVKFLRLCFGDGKIIQKTLEISPLENEPA